MIVDSEIEKIYIWFPFGNCLYEQNLENEHFN